MAMHGCTSQPFRPAREQLELLWSISRAEGGRPDPPVELIASYGESVIANA